MKKFFLFLSTFSVLIFGSLFYFYSNENPPSDISNSKVQYISLYHYFSGTLSGGINETLEFINNQQSTHKIVAHALDHEAYKSMIISTLSRGNPPELFTYWAGAKTQELVDSGKLEPLDDLWAEHSLEKLLPSALVKSASTYNTKKYFLPLDQHIVVFFYNRSVFNKFQITPPSTWNDFLQSLQILQNSSITPLALGAVERWPAQFWFDYLLLRTSGSQFRQRLMTGQASYTDEEVVKVFKIWANLLQAGYFNADANSIDWAEATRKVCSGEAAMTLMGTWAIQLLTSEACGLKEGSDFDFFAFPVIDSNNIYAAVGPVDGLVLTSNSTNSEAAKELLYHFLEKIPQQTLSSGSGAFAPSISVPKDFYSPLKQRILEEIEKTDYWAFNYDLATPPAVAEYGMDSFNELIELPDQYIRILQHLETESKKVFMQPKKILQ